MRKLILLSLSLFSLSIIFFSCSDDDKFSFNDNLLGEWVAVDSYVTSDSIELTNYIFRPDMTGSMTYDFHKPNGQIQQFSVDFNSVKFNSANRITFSSQIYRIKYKEVIKDIVFNEKRAKNDTLWISIPDSVIINQNSYWKYTKYLKSLDENMLVFTDEYQKQEYKYTKNR